MVLVTLCLITQCFEEQEIHLTIRILSVQSKLLARLLATFWLATDILGKNYVDSGTGNTWANNKYQ